MTCLEENDVLEMLGSESSANDDAREHVAHCERCRALVASVTRVLFPDAGPAPRGWVDGAELLQPGARLGDYEIRELVGQGGMGIVYAARDRRLRRKVALKILRPDSEASIDRLRQEAKIAASLSHPNIVSVYDVGEGDYGPFVAMEFVEGQDLDQWLREPRDQVAKINALRQAGEGLAAAHRAGIVHRDLKPQNILIGADGRARVVDFGLAFWSERPEGEGALVGTPAYLAPEQIRGEDVDARADQFSFCVVAYAALAGERPFRGRDLAALLGEIEAGRVVRAPAIPKRLRAVIERGLAADPADRFATMDALLRAFKRRGRRWPLAAGLVVLVGAGIWAAVPRQQSNAPEPAAAAVDEDGELMAGYERLHSDIIASRARGTWTADQERLAAEVDALRAQGEAAGQERVVGKLQILLGSIALWDFRHADAQFSFEAAYVAGTRARDPALAFEAAKSLWRIAIVVRSSEPMRQRWKAATVAAADASDDPVLTASILIFEAKQEVDNPALRIQKLNEAEGFLDETSPVLVWEELLSLRGFVNVQQGKPEEAVEDFERAFERLGKVYGDDAPEYSSTLNGLGIAQARLGRLEEAARTFERLKRLMRSHSPESPDLAAVRGNLAQIYADAGHYAKALDELRAVREVFVAFHGPEHPDASRTSAGIASALYQLGRYDEARREAEEALRWDVPDHLRVQVRLIWAASHAKLGEHAKGRPALEAIIADDEATDRDRSEARAVLQSTSPN